nr:putative retrotransposon Ty1-copia subclass protein [Tanacetum cinerariifolium]
PESDKWLEAINTEMQSMKDNQVWYLVDLPSNGQTVGCKWLFKKKTDMDGNVRTFKARLVAKGFTQTYRVDNGETFSHVAHIRDIRILLAIATFYDYDIWQMDVKTTFLNGHLSEDVYMVQPEGFVDPKHSNKRYNAARSKILALMENSKKGYTLMTEKPYYRKSQGAKTPTKVQCMQRVPYTSAIGTIQNPKRDMCSYLMVESWTRRVPSKTTFMSSIEAEYIVAAETSMEAFWMRKFIDGLGDVIPSNKRPMEMLCDNEPALAVASDPEILKGARHFQRKYHYIRKVCEELLKLLGSKITKYVDMQRNLNKEQCYFYKVLHSYKPQFYTISIERDT